MTRRHLWAAGFVVACMALAARADDTPPASTPSAENAASHVGRSIFVVNNVDGQAGDAPARHIAVNDDIVFEEDITTGSDAKAVIEFRDGSTFEIGSDAAVRIDSFVFNPEESTSHKALQVTRGVFRYVSAYVASDQNTSIKTPNGQIGIRGSVAAGIVDPAVPDFIYLGEGNATFTNAAGSATMEAGNSIAVPSAATPPMAPATMPAPVAAQALQAIDSRLPPRAAIVNRPAADDAWLKRTGAADLVPATEQQRLATAAAGTSRPLPSAAGRGGLAGELGLLTEANRLNLFDGRQATRTPEQTGFLARAARDNPNAAVTLRRFNAEAGAMHRVSMTTGTAFVIRGVGHAAPSAEVMRRVTAASTRANPGAAALITHHAADSYRGPDRGGLNRPGRPAGERPYVRPQNDFERKQPGANARAPQQQRPPRVPPRNAAPKPPPRQPPQKAPPRKRGNEKDQR